MNFEEKIKKWVYIDNQIKTYNDKIKELRNMKQELSNDLLQYANDNGLNKSVIHISDGKLRFIKSQVATPLSFKYIEKTLGEVIANKQQSDAIINHLKNNREIKTVYELKRYMN